LHSHGLLLCCSFKNIVAEGVALVIVASRNVCCLALVLEAGVRPPESRKWVDPCLGLMVEDSGGNAACFTVYGLGLRIDG
jgi:hypothetical protein